MPVRCLRCPCCMCGAKACGFEIQPGDNDDDIGYVNRMPRQLQDAQLHIVSRMLVGLRQKLVCLKKSASSGSCWASRSAAKESLSTLTKGILPHLRHTPILPPHVHTRRCAQLPENCGLGRLRCGWQELCSIMHANGLALPVQKQAPTPRQEPKAPAAPPAPPPAPAPAPDRNTQVILPVAADTSVPDWFFNCTGAELKVNLAWHTRVEHSSSRWNKLSFYSYREMLGLVASTAYPTSRVTHSPCVRLPRVATVAEVQMVEVWGRPAETCGGSGVLWTGSWTRVVPMCVDVSHKGRLCRSCLAGFLRLSCPMGECWTQSWSNVILHIY
eukprot:354633-Chlamydomonas_euryale.AAC.12